MVIAIIPLSLPFSLLAWGIHVYSASSGPRIDIEECRERAAAEMKKYNDASSKRWRYPPGYPGDGAPDGTYERLQHEGANAVSNAYWLKNEIRREQRRREWEGKRPKAWWAIVGSLGFLIAWGALFTWGIASMKVK